MNVAAKNIDPLDVANTPDNDEVAAQIKKALEAKIGDRIEVLSVIVTLIEFDKEVQDRVDRLQQAVADTRISEQRKKTAKADTEANKILADSISEDPNVLVAKCLDMLEELKGALPAGFQCWPGSGGSVVVPSAGGK